MNALASIPTGQKLALLGALQRYTKASAELGCEMYRPHFKQDMFHRLGGVKFRYVRTGNRFGKSDMGSAEDIAWCLGYRPWYPEGDPARYEGIPKRPVKGLIICTDWGKAKEIFTSETNGEGQGKLWKWLPKAAFVRRDTNHSGDINKITIKSMWGGESTLYIDTIAGWKLNSQRGESDWCDFIHVDEPIPEEMWNSYSRGLIDKNGSGWFTCTPLREPWINRFFITVPRFVLDASRANHFADGDGVFNRVVIVGSSTDNPYVTEDGINQYAAGLSDRERAARLFGRPIDESGRVHDAFNDEHVYHTPPPGWKELNKPPIDYTVRYHIDYHTRTNIAVIFAATAPDGKVYFFNEIWERVDANVLGHHIREMTKGYFVPNEWLDPSGFIKTLREESTFADDLMEFGLMVEKASKDLKRGIIMTNELLRQPGKLNFAANMTRTLFEFENYIYDNPDKRPDKVRDKDDHMMEGVHRLVLGGLSYISADVYDVPVRDRSLSLLTL